MLMCRRGPRRARGGITAALDQVEINGGREEGLRVALDQVQINGGRGEELQQPLIKSKSMEGEGRKARLVGGRVLQF